VGINFNEATLVFGGGMEEMWELESNATMEDLGALHYGNGGFEG